MRYIGDCSDTSRLRTFHAELLRMLGNRHLVFECFAAIRANPTGEAQQKRLRLFRNG